MFDEQTELVEEDVEALRQRVLEKIENLNSEQLSALISELDGLSELQGLSNRHTPLP